MTAKPQTDLELAQLALNQRKKQAQYLKAKTHALKQLRRNHYEEYSDLMEAYRQKSPFTPEDASKLRPDIIHNIAEKVRYWRKIQRERRIARKERFKSTQIHSI